MKKFLALLFVIFGIGHFSSAEAKTAKFVVQTLTPVSSERIRETYLTFVTDETQTLDDVVIPAGAMLRTAIVDIQHARPGKRGAYLTVKLIAYSDPAANNKVVDVQAKNMLLQVKKYTPTDFAGLAMSAGTTVASHVFKIPFLSQGIAVVKGVTDPIDGKNRLESAGVRLYESTPLALASKGEELDVAAGELLTVSYKWVVQDEETYPETEPAEVQNDTEPDAEL